MNNTYIVLLNSLPTKIKKKINHNQLIAKLLYLYIQLKKQHN